MGDLDDLALAVAIDEQIGARVEEDRAAHFLRPVIEVRDPTKARFDAADDDRYLAERFARALRIDDHGTIGSLASFGIRRVRIVAPDASIRGVAIHHRIHVSGSDAEEQVRFAETFEIARRAPIGLRDHADAKSLCLEHAADDRHAEAWMIDVGVARHDDDVAAIPPERIHFFPRHRQEGRSPEARRPILAIREEVSGGNHACGREGVWGPDHSPTRLGTGG